MNDNLYDAIIIGGGPAGLTAAIYLGRAKNRVLVIEKKEIGGQINITSEVVNYPGYKKTSGKELTNEMKNQAIAFNAEFLMAEVLELNLDNEVKEIKTTKGVYHSLSVVVATGASPREIGFKGEKEFKGLGVANCATCDGEFFKNLDVFVIGGGFAAAEEAIFLTRFAKKVTILIREEDFTCAKTIADKAKSNSKIEVKYNTEVAEVNGDSFVNYLKYVNNKTNEITEYNSKTPIGIFVFAGYIPQTRLLKNKVDLDNFGYVITDETMKTNITGVYAAGDLRQKNLRQVVTATSDGAIAAFSIEKYVETLANKYQVKKPDNKNIETSTESDSELFSNEVILGIKKIFSLMEKDIHLDITTTKEDELDMKNFIGELVKYTDKISYEIREDKKTLINLKTKNNDSLNVGFYGIPLGHELTSFMISIYNASSKGQNILEEDLEKINQLNNLDLKIIVSLSCTMCPETVMSAQRIATKTNNVKAYAYDINNHIDLKEKYNIMSVPCIIVNDNKVLFGKKNISELLNELIKI